jgi:uncharacterized protein (TIGR03000 family)
MLPKGSSFVCHAVRTTAALVLGLSVTPVAYTQAPSQQAPVQAPELPTDAGGPGPVVPESLSPRDRPEGTSSRQSISGPVLTPGYFEVVCPAICYGGSFHVCNIRAFAGPGYYGPFRRYWAYGTYGPSWNIGPDDSLQYGLIGGVMYVVKRSGHGCYKHGGDCACHCVLCPKGGGSLAGIYGPISQLTFLQGASQQPTDKLLPPAPSAGGPSTQPAAGQGQPQPEKPLPPTSNSAYLRIRVPKDAEVLVEGNKTTTTGTVREFVSPPLDPGKNLIYSIVVRYTDVGGKKIEETHSVRVHANDRLDIDCTKPVNAEQPRATVLRP